MSRGQKLSRRAWEERVTELFRVFSSRSRLLGSGSLAILEPDIHLLSQPGRASTDDSKNAGTLWIGSNDGASIVKVEPLD